MILTLISNNGVEVVFLAKDVKPYMTIGEFKVKGVYLPWHGEWNKLTCEILEESNEKMFDFYKKDTLNNNIKSGTALLGFDSHTWTLSDCKFLNYDSEKNTIDLTFSSVKYHS